MSAERMTAELLRTDPDDPAVAVAAAELASRIMALTEASGAERLVIGAAAAVARGLARQAYARRRSSPSPRFGAAP